MIINSKQKIIELGYIMLTTECKVLSLVANAELSLLLYFITAIIKLLNYVSTIKQRIKVPM